MLYVQFLKKVLTLYRITKDLKALMPDENVDTSKFDAIISRHDIYTILTYGEIRTVLRFIAVSLKLSFHDAVLHGPLRRFN